MPSIPNKLGLWVFHISEDEDMNQNCLALQKLRRAHPGKALKTYAVKIGGDTLHLPQSCANFTSFEITGSGQEMVDQWSATQELPQFFNDNFDGNSKAVVMIGKACFHSNMYIHLGCYLPPVASTYAIHRLLELQ